MCDEFEQIYPVDVYSIWKAVIQTALMQSRTMRPICIWHFTAFRAGKETDDEGKKVGTSQKRAAIKQRHRLVWNDLVSAHQSYFCCWHLLQ